MKYAITIAAIIAFMSAVLLARAEVVVMVTVPCNNQNWEYSPRCTAPVEHFEATPTGFKGNLTSGVTWTQDWVTPC